MSLYVAKAFAVAPLCFSMALAACAGVPKADTPAAGSAPAVSQLTADAIFRWPLQGERGRDRLLAELHRSFAMRSFADQQYSGDGPVRLSDGSVLNFAMVREGSGNIDIGFEVSPCFAVARAVELSGATQRPGFQDAHGSDVGKWYQNSANGFVLRFDTEPLTYRCVKTVHIHPVRAAAP